MRIVFLNGGCESEKMLMAVSAVGCAFSYVYGKKLIITETRAEEDGIKKAFFNTAGKNPFKEEMKYFSMTGFDYLMQKYRLGSLSFEEILFSCDVIKKSRLYILPSAGSNTREDTTGCLIKVSELASENGYATFIAAGREYDGRLLKEADLIVVCIGSGKPAIEDIFVNYVNSIDASKVFYLICPEKNGAYNKTNIRRLYRIKEEKIAQIEFDEKFEKLYKKGRSESYTKKRSFGAENAICREKFTRAAAMIGEAAAYG